jgi:hypothetical protein
VKYVEWDLQCAVVKMLREHGWIVLHIPNERNSGIADSQRMKAGGVTKGAPDLLCWRPGCFEYWLELKAPKGKRSKEQECFESIALVLGIKYLLVKTIDDIKEMLV